MFQEIPDAMAITRQNGVFRQVKVFEHDGRIFVRHGSGFVFIHGNDTSCPTVRLDEIILPFEKTYDKLGYLINPKTAKRK